MAVEVWVRNPYNYIRECVAAEAYNIAWDRGQLVKSNIDPIKHADLYFGPAIPWRAMAIGIQGTAEYRTGDSLYKPSAVYPTWEFGEELSLLEDLMANPAGEDEAACNNKRLPGDERPVFGQEHRVVVTNIPSLVSTAGRRFVATLREMQQDYPDCILHLHGLYSFPVMFGQGFKSVDIDARTNASKGVIFLPNGKKVTIEVAAAKWVKWISLLGFKPVDLKVPANRCIYVIKSAKWAAENFESVFRFQSTNTGSNVVDTTTPAVDYKAPETKSYLSAHKKTGEGDKFLCNTCSLQTECKYFRDGAVCSVPGAEPKELASFFKTRDADLIIDGLSTLTAANVRRLENGMRVEESLGDIDPEVSKLLGQVFDQGVKLAKLIDPNLRGGARVQVNVGAGGQAAVLGGNPKQLVASVIRELEAQGYSRDQITPEMVNNIIAAGMNPEQTRRSIEAGRVVDGGHEVIEG